MTTDPYIQRLFATNPPPPLPEDRVMGLWLVLAPVVDAQAAAERRPAARPSQMRHVETRRAA